jgi:putative transposase
MARVVLPHYPHHIVQRGHDRQVTFAEPRDYERYLDTLGEFKEKHGVAVYAFCLMTNHVHLLLAPREPTGIGKLMKRLAGRQTRHHNRLEGRSGTLWEGLYKSSLLQCDDYLLACCRYIELNPVRARMVAEPQDYAWSSCRYRLGRTPPIGSTTIQCFAAPGRGHTRVSRKYGNMVR